MPEVSLMNKTAPKEFPKPPVSDVWTGFEAPCRFEGEVFHLEVEGDIPEGIDGTFYRVMPDQQFPPVYDDDIWINGDGVVSAFRVKDGHVDFKQRFVQTDRFINERKARRALYGRYRNKFTDHPCVAESIRSTANTNVIIHNGVLLALKEDSPPYAMDPVTLETKGVYDFAGQLPSLTFTAHPKFDSKTGDLVAFGYEAKGEATPDNCFMVFEPNGKLKYTSWFQTPWVGLQHDFCISENYAIYFVVPLLADLEGMQKGDVHFKWDGTKPEAWGVLPRHGSNQKIRWFYAPNGYPCHCVNAYEKDGKVVVDYFHVHDNMFPFFDEDGEKEKAGKKGSEGKPEKEKNAKAATSLYSTIRRLVLDPESKEDKVEPEILIDMTTDFGHIDDRWTGLPYNRIFCLGRADDKPLNQDKIVPGSDITGGPFFNLLCSIHPETKDIKIWYVGDAAGVQEPVFIERSPDAAQGDGYVMALINRYDEMRSDLIILDTTKWEEGPIARIKLPLRIRSGLHGNWVPAYDDRVAASLCT